MDGLLCKRIALQDIKAMPKPAESRTGWETLERPAGTRDLKCSRGLLGEM